MASISDKLDGVIRDFNELIERNGGTPEPYRGGLTIMEHVEHISRLIDLIPASSSEEAAQSASAAAQSALEAAASAAEASAAAAVAESSVGTDFTLINLTLNDGYINNNGTIANQSVTNLEKYSDYFAVNPGDKFSITVTNQDGNAIWLAVGQRKSTDSWVSRSQLIGTSETSTEKVVEYTVPDEVGKISLTFRTYGTITVDIKKVVSLFYTTSDGAALEDRVALLESGGTKVNVVKPHSKVYATNHRGWHECPENTLTAYIQSAAHGFTQVETDVRFTSDGVPVLLHDSTINRTARNADGTSISDEISISSITIDEALEYDFGIYKGSEYAGEKIPTLAQFLKCCRDCGLIPYLELEGTLTTTQASKIAEVVNASGIRNDVVFIANYTDSLVSMQPYFPYNRFGVSPWTYSDTYRQAAIALFNNKAEVFMHMSYSQVTSEILAALQANNIPLEIWTVDSEAILAADAYVSGFTSNSSNAVDVLRASRISE